MKKLFILFNSLFKSRHGKDDLRGGNDNLAVYRYFSKQVFQNLNVRATWVSMYF